MRASFKQFAVGALIALFSGVAAYAAGCGIDAAGLCAAAGAVAAVLVGAGPGLTQGAHLQMGAVSIFAPPNFADIQKYQVNVASSQECIYQPLYDTLQYPAAGVSSLIFFQNPIGQSGKTLAQTNMQQGGSLPTPKYFLITDVQISFYPGIVPERTGIAEAATSNNFVNDVWAPLKGSTGYLILSVGSKQYLFDAPLCKFPPDHGFTGTAAMTTNTTQAASLFSAIDYFRPAGDIYRIVPILLIPNQNFDVTIYWPTLTPLPSGQPANMEVTMGGFQYRLSQ